MPTILCIDFDSFFASCEQHFNPNLRGKPIGVTAANGRTCVIAASREAKKYGVRTGMRTFDAIRLVPEIQFVKSDFERYYEITKKFLAICSDYAPNVELFSMDELFIDLSPAIHLYPSVEYVVDDIKRRIREEIGGVITVSVGVSHNRLLAKLASKLNKPDGFAWITPQNMDEIYARTNLTDVCGIGERLERRLNAMGIRTLFQLRKAPLSALRAEFGNVCSQHLKDIANGKDVTLVKNYKQEDVIKSVGRNYCLPQNEHDQQKVQEVIFELCEEIALKLRRLNKKARTVGLYLGGEKNMHGQKTVDLQMNRGKQIFDICMFLYNSWEWNHMVRQVHVSVSNLLDDSTSSYTLFDDPRSDELLKAVDRLNKKYGGHVVRNGSLAYAPKLKTVPNGFLADKYERSLLWEK